MRYVKHNVHNATQCSTLCLKNSQNCLPQNIVKFSQTLIIFGTPHLMYVNALPRETQMHQIVTFRGDYLYPIAHFSTISSTEAATWFINFVALNILRWK